jgi:hypothetical protein
MLGRLARAYKASMSPLLTANLVIAVAAGALAYTHSKQTSMGKPRALAVRGSPRR